MTQTTLSVDDAAEITAAVPLPSVREPKQQGHLLRHKTARTP